MRLPTCFGRTLCLVLLLLATWAAPMTAAPLPTGQLADKAVHGDFAAVAKLLQADPAEATDPAVVALLGQIHNYQQHVSAAQADRRQKHDDALVKVTEDYGQGKIEDALIAAINAHSLTDDPAALLADPAVDQVVRQARDQAAAAAKDGDWVEALNLYRELDLLFEEQGTYRDDLRKSARHVRVLQFYVPDQLEKLYQQYAQRRGEKQPPLVESEPWQRKLENVTLPMLRQALIQAERKHIDRGSYATLMRGAVDGLMVVLNTDALAEQFPGMGDHDKLTRFRDELDRIRVQLNNDGQDVHYLEIWRLIERIMDANDETVHLPEPVVVYELAEGATATLDDFSAIIWPSEVAQFSRSTQGTFVGVGIQIRRNGKLIVVTPLPNTPAQKAGVKAGDVIATVNGVSTDAWSLDRAVDEITGEAGSTVTLGVERTGSTDLINIPIKRERIAIESILGWKRDADNRWDYWIDRDAGIGYIRLTQFIPQTADDLDAAMAKLMREPNFNGLILDLRFNPGGLLSSAIDVADRFISEGTIVSTVAADGSQSDERSADPRVTYPRCPLVVLVNQGSASASEIVSGALQDYHRATIVGTRSFGKGSVQDLFPLEHGEAYLKLTTQYYMLPGGRIIHRKPKATTWGIEPDLHIEMTDQQVTEALQMRQDADILHDTDTPTGDGDKATSTASALLDQGVDLQLEGALLLLRTRHVADHIALARN